jgi:small subunit ribosomal protein S1
LTKEPKLIKFDNDIMSNIPIEGVRPTMTDLLNTVKAIPTQVGDTVSGTIIFLVKNEVLLEVENIGVGIVRGKELYNEEYIERLKVGEVVEAVVLEMDNELGVMELSFRAIGHHKIMEEISQAISNNTTVEAKIRDVNRGGFMVKVKGVDGFLPASLLSPTHAIKQVGVEDKSLLNQMKKYLGQAFHVKIININPETETVIVSEKAVSDELVSAKLSKYKIGDTVEGVVAGAVDFGLFVRFDDLDGLVHISEIAWKKVDDPRFEYKTGDKVTVKIIDIDKDNRINLSIKQTIANPWTKFAKSAKVGDIFRGKISKIVSYGIIVVNEETDIQGLCHISQISETPIENPAKIHEIVKIGDIKDFKILTLEAEEKLYLTMLDDIQVAEKIQQDIVAKQKNEKEEVEKINEKTVEDISEEVTVEEKDK